MSFSPLVRFALSLLPLFGGAPEVAAQGRPEAHDVRQVAIVVYPGVELLDFAGPGEVFSAVHGHDGHAFHVELVASSSEPVLSQGFALVTPTLTLADCPDPDLVVVPGGNVPLDDEALVAWLRARGQSAEVVMSVCNGALLLGAAGLLEDLEVTTHHSTLRSLAVRNPRTRVLSNRRFVDSGRIVTCAGVSAGIDGALQVVSRLMGTDQAAAVARYMEYEWRPDELAALHAEPGVRVSSTSPLTLAQRVREVGVEKVLAEVAREDLPAESEFVSACYRLAVERADDVQALMRLASAAFPDSGAVADASAELLEFAGQRESALAEARRATALLARDASSDRARSLHEAAAARVERLEGRVPDDARFACPPCGEDCDTLPYRAAGECRACGMPLAERRR